jgi:16S rRNA (adenine1518-N6/adenine1519-N6)-dimethyltransferase
MVLTIQQEVARRVCAPAGSLSLLALSVQVFGQPSIVMEIPAGAFYPPPKVNSAVLKVELYDQPAIPEERLDDFFALAKAGFSQRRKTLRNTLSAGLRLTPAETARRLGDAGIDPMRRAETLTLAEWDTLTGHFPLITPRRTHPTSQ